MLGGDTHLSCRHLLPCQIPLAKTGTETITTYSEPRYFIIRLILMEYPRTLMYAAVSSSAIQEDMNLLKETASLTNAHRK